jgi:hypothetical protein
MPRVTLFTDINFGGAQYVVNDAVAQLPPGVENEVSSIRIEGSAPGTFTVLWEARGFDGGDDALWLEGNGELHNLHTLRRPHGNNHWGDRVSGVSFQAAPQGSTENRTILYHGRRDYTDGEHGLRQLDATNPNWG